MLCPRWVGEDPHGETCDSAMAWRIDRGTIEGGDVFGRTLALSFHIPGNILARARSRFGNDVDCWLVPFRLLSLGALVCVRPGWLPALLGAA